MPDASTDTMVWCPSVQDPTPFQVVNWYDQNTGKQATQLPGPTNPIALDGNVSNTKLEIPSNWAVLSLTVRNNYNNTLQIDEILTTDANDSVQKGSILTLVGSFSGLQLTGGANFTVASGATLNLKDNPANGQSGTQFMYGDGTAGEYLNNQGTVNWNGTATTGPAVVMDQLQVPVLNSGTFNANGGTGGDTSMVGAVLNIQGYDEKTYVKSFYQTAGALNLTNNATVNCGSDYDQVAGSLTSDSSPCTLSSNNGTGNIYIDGGKVIVDTVANSVSTLTFTASNVDINGEIDLNGLTTGGKSNRCDLLDCSGATVTLGANSFLNVTTTGGAALGTGNQWIVMKYASINGTWGTVSVPPTMSSSTGLNKVMVTN